MDDLRSYGVCLGLRDSHQRAGDIRLDGRRGRTVPADVRVGKPGSGADPERLVRGVVLRRSRDDIRVLLRAYCGRDATTDTRDGRAQRPGFSPGQCLTDPVQTH